ncbi:anthranilate synthase component I family protein [Leptospira langatensis]|uniref:Anthranilate synthase component I family protein n=1 Tax=Leptospira langatensis TaxID=2484983 RepID=A0A5F1ZTX0_9LEPT|nr:anthranilate synthase component I family protein [Leptospira langatensis]TGJ98817.1 anthranilate synthase component I family protein [Leptospira langatensis]TGL40616.1 anthranilate synthase component I family protein [Leptospira langatensis]
MSIEVQNLRKEAKSLSPKPILRPFPLKEEDILEFFQRLLEVSETSVLLESLGPETDNSRFSFISAFPKRIFSAKEDRLYGDGKEIGRGNPYELLSQIFSPNTSFLEYTEAGGGGLYGYLSYEAANDMEPSLGLKEHPRFPKFQFAWMEDGILIDRRTGESKYFHYGTDRYSLFEEAYRSSAVSKAEFFARDLGFSKTKEEHRQMVELALEEIRKGNTFQCQLGFRKTFQVGKREGDFGLKQGDLELYKALRKVNPSPFMFFLSFSDEVHLGASPELLFRLKDGLAESFPLAGTIRRGISPEEDQRLALQLFSDPKEIAEHNMLVDLHRNDLGRVSKFGTVKVRDSFSLKRFSHVQHLSTEVSGILRPGKDMFSGLAASFPTGTLSGAPKIESMKIIQRIENDPRGPYGGAVGKFGFDGNCSFCIPIRSYFRKKEEAVIRASGGIVIDSDPDYEYAEIGHKLGAVLKAMEVLR